MKKTILLLILLACFSEWTNAQELQVPFGGLRARNIGPAVMSGRVSDIEALVSDPKVLYVGSAGGGVWQSIDAGASFRPIFDEHTMSIGNIAVDQNHPDTIWVGTGEPWVRNSVSVGTGVFLSTNGGKTWKNKGLLDSEHISKVIADPTPGTVFVAAQGHLWGSNDERGIYKSTDLGETWERVLYVDEKTGAADLAQDPQNPSVLYAAMWEHQRYPDFFNSGGPGSGLYKSTDGGATWENISENIGATSPLGRMAIAIAPSDPNVLYLSVECSKKEEKGLYRSNDAGKTWEQVSTDFGTTVRPFYFSRMVVDPVNADKVYKCGLNLIVSEDGGRSFRTVGSGVHSDVHAVWVNPGNPEMVYIGTDGGAYRSLDGGRMFEMFMNLPISQFYQISVDDDKPFNVYGGLQDNGSWYGPSSSPGGIENKDWELSYWGDGFYSFRHPTDKNIIYSESQGGNLARYNKADGQAKAIQPLPGADEPEYRFNWNAPVHISPNNPERLYFAAQFVFKTEDRGDSWDVISPDLTTNDPERQRQKESGGLSIDNSTAENNATIYTLGESPVQEKILWAGTDDGNLQVTADGGKTWTNVAPNIPGLPAGLWCTQVEPGHHDANTCYVTFDGHRSNDKAPYVYKTTDLGKTWTSIVTDAIEGYALSIREDLVAPNLLFLGTEFGLYVSLDSGTSWKRFDNNLPKVGIRAMAIHPRDHALVMGTHGRGVYIIDNIQPLREINAEVAGKELHFFDQGPTYLRLARQGTPFGGAGSFVGQNPSDAASITYFMKRRHAFGPMTVSIYDKDDNLVRELPAGKSAGVNLVELPTRLPMPKAAPTNNRMALFGSIFPPTLPEGEYKVKVKKGKKEFETKIQLEFDPEANYTKADRDLAHQTQMRLYNMTNELGYMYYQLQSMHEQATKHADALTKMKLVAQLNTFAKTVEGFKDGLVSMRGDFYVDEGSNIREEISTLYLQVGNYPGKPSEGQLNKAKQLEDQLAEVRTSFEAYKTEMQSLNERLEKAELMPITIQTFDEYIKG